MQADTIIPNATSGQAFNRYSYAGGNPLRYIDPTGHMCVAYGGTDDEVAMSGNCNGGAPKKPKSGWLGGGGIHSNSQYDLTGYLASAMTAHSQDPRLLSISNALTNIPSSIPSSLIGGPDMTGSGQVLGAYLDFVELESTNKIWDIKQQIHHDLGGGVVLCGEMCDWYDSSAVGNIHFGYVAGIAGIDSYIAAVAGGALEQRDLILLGQGPHLEYCNGLACDDPADQAAVDFGYSLAEKYPKGITEAQLRSELTTSWTDRFERLDSFNPPFQAAQQINLYGPERFNCCSFK